jgi:hypothetical protein
MVSACSSCPHYLQDLPARHQDYLQIRVPARANAIDSKPTPNGGPGCAVNALPHVSVRFYDGRAAASYILGIRKEVLAMFADRQTPPGVAF